MHDVLMYSSSYCPYCTKAKELFNKKNISFTEICVDSNPKLREEMQMKSGQRTVPQIFINGLSIGGCDDLHSLEARGQLNQLLIRINDHD